MKKIIYVIFLVILVSCSSFGSNEENINYNPEFIFDKNKTIDKKYFSLYEKYGLIVYDRYSFRDVFIKEPTVVFIDHIVPNTEYYSGVNGMGIDINGDGIKDVTHGMLTMKTCIDDVNIIGLELNAKELLVEYKSYYELIEEKILSGQEIIAVIMPKSLVNSYGIISKRVDTEVNSDNIGDHDIQLKILEWLKSDIKVFYDIITQIDKVSKLVNVYLPSGNNDKAFGDYETYNLFLSAENALAIGGTNRTDFESNPLFTDNSRVDRYERAVSIIYITDNGYDIDEDGETDFIFDDISSLPYEKYPDNHRYNKKILGEPIEEYLLKIDFSHSKKIRIVDATGTKIKEIEYIELISNWEDFINLFSDNIFNISDIITLFSNINNYSNNNDIKLNSEILELIGYKNDFLDKIGLKDSDNNRFFTHLNKLQYQINRECYYTVDSINNIIPSGVQLGTSFAVVFAFNKDYEAGLLTDND